MRNTRKFILPAILMLVGLAWLFSKLDIFTYDYFWTIILLFIGSSILASGGFRRGSFVSGMFFIVWSLLQFLIDIKIMIPNVLYPLLLLSLGALLLINRSDLIPEKDREKEWKKDKEENL